MWRKRAAILVIWLCGAQVASAQTVTVNGTNSPPPTTMQSAVAANANGTPIVTTGYGQVLLDVLCSTCSGGTLINFEQSVDNSVWNVAYAYQEGTASTLAATTTATGLYRIPVGASVRSVRARISAYSAGTVTVKGYLGVLSSPLIASNTNVLNTVTVGLPSGASTAAKQPALGTAGTPSADVISIQGVASGTVVPISAASLPLPSLAATSTKQSDGSQKTQIVDGSGNVIASTSNNLNVQCANCSGSGASAADEASFTAGVSTFAPSGGFFQTTATSNALTNGQQGMFQATANRAIFSNLRNAAGTEVGTSTTPLQVSLANTAANATAVKVDGSAVTQPVSGSGSFSVVGTGIAGTPAGSILTVQGAASMTKLLVTPDAVALPANQSVNVNQLAGTTTDTNSGSKSAGTLRVVLATDQPALTNKLLVTPDSVALPANQSVNMAQVGGTNTVNAGVSGVIAVGGNIANGVAATANPVPVGGIFTTTPTTLSSGQTATMQFTAAQNMKNDLTTVAGTATAVNSGNKDAGTMRVVIATDQPALTNKLLVTPDLPALASTSTKQSDGSQKTQIVDGSGNVIASTSNNLNVQCANCSGSGASAADEASFTAGSSTFAPSGGFFQTTATNNALTTGQQGMFQATANRALFVNFRNAAGTEIGTSTTPVQVSLANTAANATAVKVDGSAVTQPVSGTITANAGTNLNTSALALESGGNLATVAGAVIAQEATTSGVKGVTVFGAVTTAKPTYTTAKSDALSLDVNGLLRVSLADTPANGTKLLVTPDSVALPANQSVNISQINAVTPLMGNGASGTGAQRVTIANDSTGIIALTTSTAQIGHLEANQSSNVAQINGVTPLMGNGASGTGAQRVTLANDSTGVIATVSAVTAITNALPTGTNTIGSVKQTDGTNVVITDPCAGQAKVYLPVNQTAGATLITGTSAKKLYICSVFLFSATAQNINLVEGTGTVCATGIAGVTGGTTSGTGPNLAANQGFTMGNGAAAVIATATNADNLCLQQSGAGQVSGHISYAVQ